MRCAFEIQFVPQRPACAPPRTCNDERLYSRPPSGFCELPLILTTLHIRTYPIATLLIAACQFQIRTTICDLRVSTTRRNCAALLTGYPRHFVVALLGHIGVRTTSLFDIGLRITQVGMMDSVS